MILQTDFQQSSYDLSSHSDLFFIFNMLALAPMMSVVEVVVVGRLINSSRFIIHKDISPWKALRKCTPLVQGMFPRLILSLFRSQMNSTHEIQISTEEVAVSVAAHDDHWTLMESPLNLQYSLSIMYE